jgi:hypothetical protein
MKVKKQKIRYGNVIIATADNGKDKIKIIRPFKKEVSDELVENIITGMYHSQVLTNAAKSRVSRVP